MQTAQILIVEDELVTRNTLKSIFEDEGYQVHEANDGEEMHQAGDTIRLPRSEFRAMLHFCENPGQIQTRAELLMKMTGRELKPHDRTVDVTIRRIRKHFESFTETPEIIATIHGEGYRFCGTLETA